MSNISPVLTESGLEVKTTSEIRSAVEQDWKNALGQEMNTAVDTPQGQLITSETLIIRDKDNALLEIFSSFNPQLASGTAQDALCSLYLLERKSPLPSYVYVECVGLPNTYIRSKNDNGGGAIIKSTRGDLFVCSSGGTIASDGKITLQFESVEVGLIPVFAGTLTNIYTTIQGWDTCNNSTDGIIGRDQESRAELEKRRLLTLALNSTGSVDSILSAVLNVDGVLGASILENVTSQTLIKDGVSMKPHSVYVCAVGGTIQEIGQAIYKKKSAGCNTNGSLKVNINGIDIYFDRPNLIPIKIRITLDSNSIIIEKDIKDAIFNNFYGINKGKYAGMWDALNNTPTLSNTPTINQDEYYLVTNAGTFLDKKWSIGDIIICSQDFNGNKYWVKRTETLRPSVGENVYSGRFYCSIRDINIANIDLSVKGNVNVWQNYIEISANSIATLSYEDILITFT